MTAVFDTVADEWTYQSPASEVTEATCRHSVGRARTHLEMAANEVVWQISNRAWEHLGYASWDEMREAEYGGVAVMVPRGDRPELVGQLRALGMTQQSIADTIGVTEGTVRNDLNRNSAIQTPATVTNARGQERPASYAPRTSEPAEPVDAADLVDEDGPELDEHLADLNARAHLSVIEATVVEPAPLEATPVPAPRSLDEEAAIRDNQQREVEAFGIALVTLQGLLTEAHRLRVHEAWDNHPEGASPYNRALHVPETMHRLADVLHTYATEREQRHA